MSRKLGPKYAFLVLLITTPMANAKSMKLCNRSPLKADMAVAYTNEAGDFISEGWFATAPGECANFSGISGQYFYYHAQSKTDLAYWLNGGDRYVVWEGKTNLCFHPSNRFKYVNQNTCAYVAKYQQVMLAYDTNEFSLIHNNYPDISIEQASEVARDLDGVMNWERHLKNTPGRENPFQIGAGLEKGTQGARVAFVVPGLPAEFEGIETGDEIVGLDGFVVETPDDVISILGAIPFDRKTPLQITITRRGEIIEGVIEPLFFPFNHPLYANSSPEATFAWEIADGIPFMLGNEVACGAKALLFETLNSLGNDAPFNGARIANSTRGCAETLNKTQELYRIFHEEAATAGVWAGLVAGGTGLLKAGKLGELGSGAKLAGKSRFVRHPALKRRSLR